LRYLRNALLVLLGALADAKNLRITVVVHAIATSSETLRTSRVRHLKSLPSELGYLQPDFSSLGVQPTFVVASPGIPTGFAPLIALRIAQPPQRPEARSMFLHAAAHHPVEVL
jgi:hypothetical protein